MVATANPISEIDAIVSALPPDAQREVLHFALFLQTRLADDAWDAALEETTDEQTARINTRIDSQRVQSTPLFNDTGKVAAGC